MRNRNLRILVQCAILVAIGTVLSFSPFEMPLGGTITFGSMIPICLIGLMHGPKWGFGSAFIYSVIQLLISKCFGLGLTPTVLVVCILFDYIVAFTVLGITGFFAKRGRIGMCFGVALAVVLRMVCHYITGVTIWEASMPDDWNNIWLYSLAYNGFYMLPEMIITMIGTVTLTSIPQFNRLMKTAKQ